MEKSKLIQLFKSLTKKEFNEFEYFVKCPCHNKDKDAIKIYLYLKRYYPKFESQRLQKEKIAKFIYGKEDSKHITKLKYPMSNLTKCVEAYILWKAVEDDQYNSALINLEAYQKRGLDHYFFNKVETVKKKFDKEFKIDINHYLLQYRLHSLLYRHSKTSRLYGKQNSILKEKNDYLDLFIISAKLNEKLIILNRNFIEQEERDLLLIENIIYEAAHQSKFSENPLFSAYLFFIKYFNDKGVFNREDYDKVKHYIFKKFSILGKNEGTNVFILLLQYTQQLHEKGTKDLAREYFEICCFGIENKILYFNGHILPFIFLSTVQAACALDEQDWVKQFMEKYIGDLPNNDQHNIELLSNAYLQLSLKKYDLVLEFLRQVDYQKNYHYDIIMKVLTIMCFYENKEYVLLKNFLDTFYAYIHRHKEMSNQLKEKLINFIRFVTILEKNIYNKKMNQKELQKKLSQIENVYARIWLRKRILLF